MLGTAPARNGHFVVRRRLWRSRVILFPVARAVCGRYGSPRDRALLGRELNALGHKVKLMPPATVKAFVKRNNNDAADAEAICEAITRPSMRFVPVKATEQSVDAASGACPPSSPEFAWMFRLIGTLTIAKIMADTAIMLDGWTAKRRRMAGGSGPWVIA